VLVDRVQQLLRRRRHGIEDEAQLLEEREPVWADLDIYRSAAAVLEPATRPPPDVDPAAPSRAAIRLRHRHFKT
jgi:hypothetical protein